MRMTRRRFLRSSGAAAVAGGLTPLQGALAATLTGDATRPRTLVVVFLRGGIDGLNLIAPYGDPDYAALRPALRVPTPAQHGGAIDLDGFFGLHPRAAALRPWFERGLAAAVHAVGHPAGRRAHFEEQDVWETGMPRHTFGADGWLNRHLQASAGHGPVRAVALSDTLPRALRGAAPAYAVGGPDVAEMMTTHDRLQGVLNREYQPSTEYGGSPLAQRLQTAAALIKGNIGTEVIHLDHGGWDTHNRQGPGGGGFFGDKVQELADALGAFAADLGPRLRDVLVLTVSEFGRTAAENGTGGTDHGGGNAVLALGGVDPGASAGRRKVIADWPGLRPQELHQGRGLRPTIDFRDMFAEVVHRHLGNDRVSAVLPGHACKPIGLLG